MSRRFSVFLTAGITAFAAACGGGDDGINDPGPGTPDPFLGCATVQASSVPNSVNGSLTTTDCKLFGSYIDYYEIRLTSQRSITTVLTSSQVDAYLFIFDRATGQEIAEDDDSAGGTNSRIQQTLAPGTYIIGATSFDVDEVGTYQLSIN